MKLRQLVGRARRGKLWKIISRRRSHNGAAHFRCGTKSSRARARPNATPRRARQIQELLCRPPPWRDNKQPSMSLYTRHCPTEKELLFNCPPPPGELGLAAAPAAAATFPGSYSAVFSSPPPPSGISNVCRCYFCVNNDKCDEKVPIKPGPARRVDASLLKLYKPRQIFVTGLTRIRPEKCDENDEITRR